MKIGAAPISWGVSELPTWGYRMAPDRVLREMNAVGFEATELGPSGYLPEDPKACRELLERHGLRLVAGFLATVLHESPARAHAEIEKQAAVLASAGGEMLVLAAALPEDSYDTHAELSSSAWRVLGETLAAAQEVAARHKLGLAFHPHAGTAVESDAQVQRLLDAFDVDLCLDTGHLILGGTDPVLLIEEAAPRITHVHLKDVDLGLASKVGSNKLSYAEAVAMGLYRPLGQGDLDIEAVFNRLQQSGYKGWFVLEQDTALTADPEPSSGPIEAARQSLEYFRGISSAKQHITAYGEE
jgi:inosose dehydratase